MGCVSYKMFPASVSTIIPYNIHETHRFLFQIYEKADMLEDTRSDNQTRCLLVRIIRLGAGFRDTYVWWSASEVRKKTRFLARARLQDKRGMMATENALATMLCACLHACQPRRNIEGHPTTYESAAAPVNPP